MQPSPGYYSLIQFCPDSSRLEALNVGIVLLCPDSKVLRTRWAHNAKPRLRKVFATDFSPSFDSERDSIEHRLTIAQQPSSQAELQLFSETRAGTLRITPPRFVKVFDVDQEVERLFLRLVPDAPATEKKSDVAKRLRDDLKQQKLLPLVRNPVEIELPELGKTIRAKFSFPNGRTNILQPQAFPATRDGLLATTGRLALEGQALYKLKEYKLLIVADFGRDASEAARIARPQLENHHVTLYDCADLRGLHRAIEESAREHGLMPRG